jgi:hypothetical protein
MSALGVNLNNPDRVSEHIKEKSYNEFDSIIKQLYILYFPRYSLIPKDPRWHLMSLLTMTSLSVYSHNKGESRNEILEEIDKVPDEILEKPEQVIQDTVPIVKEETQSNLLSEEYKASIKQLLGHKDE